MTNGRDPGPQPRAVVLEGRDRLAPRPTALRAGPVELLLDGFDLRHIRIGDVELAQRVYVAVRDAPWNTIPARVSDLVIEPADDRFEVRFTARHAHEDIDFRWQGRIVGTPEGVIEYALDGRCHGVFQYSKIGFNVHHALDGTIGRPYRARTADGELRGVFEEAIAPQRIVDGTLTGMFAPYDQLAIEVIDGTEAVVELEGDLLELQDHRNWTDANLKSYGTPLALGFPFTSTDGQVIAQRLRVRHLGRLPERVAAEDPVVRVGEVAGALPRIGLGMASHGQPLTAAETELLRALRPDHLRVDLPMRDGPWEAALGAGIGAARALDAHLELAVAANAASEPHLARLAELLRAAQAQVDRVLVHPLADGFSAFVSTTPAETVRQVAGHLRPVLPGAVFAGGTDQNLADITRQPPTDPAIEAVCFSISPTVHAADDASIMENIQGAAEAVRFAHTFTEGSPGGRPVVVSPVTIATRFGPYPAGPPVEGDLPPAVDVRQLSLLGAAWVVGELSALTDAGAASATWFETTGWRGVIERTDGSPMPDRFRSVPGQVFPMYHVLADVAEWRPGRALRTSVSQHLRVAALGVEEGSGRRHLLVANLTPEACRVRVDGLAGERVRVRTLDEATAAWALTDPAAYRALDGALVPVRAGSAWLSLGPWAVARVDPTT